MKAFKGAYTALITPFTDEDELNEEGLIHLLQRQLSSAIDGVVLLGTTGESPTLSEKEKKRIIEIAKHECKQTSLIIGTGSYSTKQTIINTIAAEQAGADAALIVTPYYNKPTQEGFYQHFKAITEVTELPIIIYNIPGRCSQNLQTETLKRLLEFPTIVGVKEASGNISQINDVIELARQHRPEFSVLSGDDALTLPLMALGGHGVISVISNLLPKEVKELVDTIASGDFQTAQQLHYNLMPLIKMAFIETNPIPIKALHELHDLPAGKCRLPLCNLSEANYELLRKARILVSTKE